MLTGDRTELNSCQISTMWNRLMTSNTRQIVDCSESHLLNYEVNEDMTWSNDLNLYGDVIIDNKSTLTVTCTLHFSEDRKIIVHEGSQLILDGALLTSLDACAYKWRGIKVVGDMSNDDYDVVIKTGSRIENAVEAINMQPPVAWPEAKNFGNGTVRAYNATFANNNKDIGFISFQPEENNSLITNCDFIGSREAITNWNGQGIEVRGSRFQEIQETSIFSGSGSFDLIDNEFYSGIVDVYMAAEKATKAWLISFNEFYGPTGILNEGGTITSHTIRDNKFFSQGQGAFMDGISSFDFFNNELNDNEVGIVSVSTTFENVIHNSTFTSCRIGIEYEGANNNSSFIENCFSNDRLDVYIFGEIFDFIGNDYVEAGNCFTDDQNGSGIGVPKITGNHDHFDYFLFEDNDANCKDVIPTTFFDIAPSGSATVACQTGEMPPHDNPWPFTPEINIEFTRPLTDNQAVRVTIDDLVILKGDIANEGGISAERRAAIKTIDNKIDELSLLLVDYHLSNFEYEAARHSLNEMVSKYKPAFLGNRLWTLFFFR